ncbi:hypothetical protein CR513_53502, partial [Mucuna pruriens]
IEQFFAKHEKAEMSNLLAKLISMKYKGKENIKECIMEMSNLAAKLKSLKLDYALVSYNTQKDKWSLNELISHCVQEEERLQRDKIESAHLTSTSQNKKRKNIKGIAEGFSQGKKPKKNEAFTYFFCKKSRHMKKQCPKMAYEVDHQVMMKDSFLWAMTIKQNFISISSLDKFGFSCSFGNNKVSLYQNSNVVGFGSLVDNLYMLDVVSSHNKILQISSRGTNQKLIENSTILWHKRLGHISK